MDEIQQNPSLSTQLPSIPINPNFSDHPFCTPEFSVINPNSSDQGFCTSELPVIIPHFSYQDFCTPELPVIIPDSSDQGFCMPEIPVINHNFSYQDFCTPELPVISPNFSDQDFCTLELPVINNNFSNQDFCTSELPVIIPNSSDQGFCMAELPVINPNSSNQGFYTPELSVNPNFSGQGTLMPEPLENPNSSSQLLNPLANPTVNLPSNGDDDGERTAPFSGSCSSSQGFGAWTAEELEAFEVAFLTVMENTPDRWKLIADLIPSKPKKEVLNYCMAMFKDLATMQQMQWSITPQHLLPGATSMTELNRDPAKNKKRELWTEEEHRMFIRGLKIYGEGKSRWKNIEKFMNFSKTSSQIGSHAQKYFTHINKRQQGSKRSSIHDITIDDDDETDLDAMMFIN